MGRAKKDPADRRVAYMTIAFNEDERARLLKAAQSATGNDTPKVTVWSREVLLTEADAINRKKAAAE